jgi:hypothetical protein
MKECVSFAGIIKSGKNMTAMMNNEFLCLIHVYLGGKKCSHP